MNDAIKLYKTVKNDVEHKKNIKVLTIHGIVISEKVMTIRRMREMNITDVRIRKVETDNRMKAIASITLDDCFVIHDLRVIQGDEHLFVAMPSRKTSTGEFKDIAHPINHETRQELEQFVIKAYEATE